MTDIVERLRGEIPHRVIEDHWTVDFHALDAEREEAANGIERLRANLYQEEATTEALEAKLAAIATESERLRGLIKEAISLARRNHYGNMYIEIENFAEGISLLEDNLEGK